MSGGVVGARLGGLARPLAWLRASAGDRIGPARGYVWGLAVLLACTAVWMLGGSVMHAAESVIVFPLGVLFVAARFGIGPGVCTTVAGVLLYDFLFIPPTWTLAVADRKSMLTLVVMLAVAITAAVLAEQLRRREDEARRQTDVERLRNALLSALSHDLKAPLTALVGASTLLSGDSIEEKERKVFARMVADEATRLDRLVGTLLELTRLESVHANRTPQAIDEVIGAAVCRLEGPLRDRAVHTDVPESIPLVACDPVLVHQVILNLLENVLRYTPAGSPVDIAARREGDSLLVEVADHGPGVPPGDEARVFERLYRGGARAKDDGGIGLGLTICRAIVVAHGGRIWLQNRPAGGALVRFTLPLDRAAQLPGPPLTNS
jgi:two-component system sensor histidine kinase KdpD